MLLLWPSDVSSPSVSYVALEIIFRHKKIGASTSQVTIRTGVDKNLDNLKRFCWNFQQPLLSLATRKFNVHKIQDFFSLFCKTLSHLFLQTVLLKCNWYFLWNYCIGMLQTICELLHNECTYFLTTLYNNKKMFEIKFLLPSVNFVNCKVLKTLLMMWQFFVEFLTRLHLNFSQRWKFVERFVCENVWLCLKRNDH